MSVLYSAVDVIGQKLSSGEQISSGIKSFIEPLLFLVVAIVAITFLVRRQMTQFFSFAALAALVALFWWQGETVLKAVSNFFGQWFGGGS